MKKWFIRWLVVMMLLPGFASAQALPASAVQRSIAGMIEKKMVQRGFASNDPRWATTLQSTGSGIAGAALAAAAVTAAGVTAPAWATVAATVALGGLLAAGINLAIDGVKWLINPDGTVKYTASGGVYQTTPSDSKNYAQVQVGYDYIIGYSAEDVLEYYNRVIIAQQYPPAQYGTVTRSMSCGTPAPYGGGGGGTQRACGIANENRIIWEYRNLGSNGNAPASWSCPSGSLYNTGTGKCEPIPASAPQEVTKSPSEAADALTPEQKAKPANPDLMARIADEAWKKAASSPDYKGVPYDSANPITASDADAYRAANPADWPKVGDLVAPQPSGSTAGSPSPWSLPSSAAAPAPLPEGGNTTPPITGPTLDWAIPNYGEKIGNQAVPVSFVPTVFAAPTGCPAPVTFTMLGKSYSISYGPFCDLMATLAPLFLALGAAAAALIFAESLKS